MVSLSPKLVMQTLYASLTTQKCMGLAQDPSASHGSLWGNLGADFTGLGFSSANVPRELKQVPFMEKTIQDFFF